MLDDDFLMIVEGIWIVLLEVAAMFDLHVYYYNYLDCLEFKIIGRILKLPKLSTFIKIVCSFKASRFCEAPNLSLLMNINKILHKIH